MSSFFEWRLVADRHFSLTVSGLTRFYLRPVPVLLLLVLGFGRFCVIYVCLSHASAARCQAQSYPGWDRTRVKCFMAI